MNTFHLATVKLAEPVTVYIPANRPRVVTGQTVLPGSGRETILEALQCAFYINVVTQTIYAQIARIPKPLMIYGPADFAAACADLPEQHGERVLQCLGSDPAKALQALIDGAEMPPVPVRVPRSIRAWQARELLRRMGLLDKVVSMVEWCGDTAVIEAWEARENLARRGKTVLAVAANLDMDEAAIDQFFLDAAKLEV
jgi:hypothetical protein